MSHPDPGFGVLAHELRSLFELGVGTRLEEPRFNDLALRIFSYQFEHNTVFGEFCRKRGQTPGRVRSWTEIPVVPTTAFKQLPLLSGGSGPTSVMFRTSGTTGDGGGRGTHHVRDLSLYHGALLPNYRTHLVPEGRPLRTLSLIPSPADQPDSSLSHMVGQVMERFGDGESAYLVDTLGGLDHQRFLAEARRAAAEEIPVVLLGTAFAFVHLVDALADMGEAVELPSGSRVMETGGFKGRSRELGRADLHLLLGRYLGVDDPWIVGEYGMTEMLSQFYDGIAGSATAVRKAQDGQVRLHRPPPWVRSRVLNPVSLEPVPYGESGILAHLDLANLGTVCSILTEDVGIAAPDGFQVLGRAPGAESRGCSIAMDDLLTATGSIR